jgi:hypothetical protein
MGIYWVDPYIWSPNGGIHGTVSVGGGSYTNPWSLGNIITQAGNTNLLTTDDEIRIKGLPESDFFEATANTWTLGNTTISGQTYTTSYSRPSSQNNRLYRAQTSNLDIFYGVFDQSVGGTFQTTYGASTWYAGMPNLNASYGYFLMKPQYVLSNLSLGTGTKTLFNNNIANITITAGWTSETEQLGETIWFANNSSVLGTTQNWGPSTNFITWDCGNLIIGLPDTSATYNLLGDSLKFKALAGPTYSSSGRFSSITAGRSAGSHKSNSGNIKIDALNGGGYGSWTVSGTASLTNYDHRITLPFIINGYQTSSIRPFRNTSVSNNVMSTVSLNEFYGYDGITLNSGTTTVNAGNLTINIGEGYEFVNTTASGSIPLSVTNSATPPTWTEIWANSNKTKPFPTNINYNLFGGWTSTPSSTQNYLAPQAINMFADAASKFKRASISTQTKTAVKNLIIQSPGINTLEGVFTPMSFHTNTPTYANPFKVNIFADTSTYKPLQLMGPMSPGVGAMVYNNSNYNGRLAWKLFSEGNGLVYADIYSLPLPNYSANNISFSTSFNTIANPGSNSDPGVAITVRLYGWSQISNSMVSLSNISGVQIDDVVYANIILTSANLINSLISSLYTVVDVLKNNAQSNTEIIFNTFNVTQV